MMTLDKVSVIVVNVLFTSLITCRMMLSAVSALDDFR